ncbi:hypothetical protein [Burkholderia ubonensis]|uniref:hypothetical protein n=1 Tax=Burkholderia ubonensis TaxID=101571 RepID=UPI00075A8CCB|nr:hypothetical protein [Burkholderia ubonensis]KVP39766.1 hypothetical protein WJ87_06165 [Burkholderia ubonensis]
MPADKEKWPLETVRHHIGAFLGACKDNGMRPDDELANAAYLNYDTRPPVHELVAGTAFMPIVYMTAVKERIRWLSRKLAESTRSHDAAAQ